MIRAAAILLTFVCGFSAAADVVVAEIGAETVTDRELAEVIALLPREAREEIATGDNRRKFVENYVTWKLLVAEAKRRNVEKSPEFARRLERAKNDVLLGLLQENLRDELPVTEKDLKSYYESHLGEFTIPERRRARHILVSDEKKAAEILKRIRGGVKFESEAKLHSEDAGTAGEGGDIGLRERAELVPEFAKIVFSLKPGEVFDRPLKTRFGWHVVRLDSVTQEGRPKWSEIREEVRRRYLSERSAAAIPELVKTLREKTSIKIHDENLTRIGPK